MKIRIGVFLMLAVLLSSQASALESSTTSATPQSLKELRMQHRDTMIKTREEFHDAMMKAREDFKAKLAQLKDQRKKVIVERLDEKLAMINKRRTDKMTQALAKLKNILARLKKRAENLKTSGKDTSAADAAITNAENKITLAENAVSAQSGKDYAATISGELTLHQTMGQEMSQVQNDLRSAHTLVREAKQAVMRVVMELAKLGGLGRNHEASGSAQ